jgi:hypothetical protein
LPRRVPISFVPHFFFLNHLAAGNVPRRRRFISFLTGLPLGTGGYKMFRSSEVIKDIGKNPLALIQSPP